jgi:hypothetical protein
MPDTEALDGLLRRAVDAIQAVADDRTRRPDSREIRLKNLLFLIERLCDEQHDLIDK